MQALKNFFADSTNVYTTAIVAVLIAAYFLFAPKDEAVAATKKKKPAASTATSAVSRKSSRVAGDTAPEVGTTPETRGRTGTRSTTPKRSARLEYTH